MPRDKSGGIKVISRINVVNVIKGGGPMGRDDFASEMTIHESRSLRSSLAHQSSLTTPRHRHHEYAHIVRAMKTGSSTTPGGPAACG